MSKSNRHAKHKSKGPHKVEKVSERQVRKTARRSQAQIGMKTIQVKELVSQRGRTHWMQEEAPGMTTTHPEQDVLMHSTAIAKFKYYLKEKRLRLWWKGKRKLWVYDYYEVPESVVLTFAQAQSKGNYAYYNIRTSYRYERIR